VDQLESEAFSSAATAARANARARTNEAGRQAGRQAGREGVNMRPDGENASSSSSFVGGGNVVSWLQVPRRGVTEKESG
jgi:hypothetical protein